MAGEPILIVDDTPVNLKLTRILLVNEGYTVLTAGSAEEALELLARHHPKLILADIQLPAMDGLEMTRRIKQNASTRDIAVVALTAFAMRGDEQRALEAGCDGYITKPIDTRTLGTRIRELLTRGGQAAPPVASRLDGQGTPGADEGLPPVELQVLRRRFLQEGQERTRELLLDLDGAFHAAKAARAVHQWVGAGGLLGYSELSRLSREVEAVLLERPLDAAQLRESMTNLLFAFSTSGEAAVTPVPESIAQVLGGKNVAVAGLPAFEIQRLGVALERVHAKATIFELSEAVETDALAQCDLLVAYIPKGGGSLAWLDQATRGGLPTVLVGDRQELLALDPEVPSRAAGLLMDSWQPEEALVRLALAVTGLSHPVARSSTPAVPRVLVADGDESGATLASKALQNSGMESHTVGDGAQAMEVARRLCAHAAIIDIEMPGMDGYQVLAAMRAENLQVPVLLLTTRQTEYDVIRGFSLGAGDYMVKPFSPLELVARVKRLLGA